MELYGLAVGRMGMMPSEFWECTPDEIAAALKAYNEAEESRERAAWERMRIHATITIQPHCKQRLKPAKLVPLPWDSNHKALRPKRPSKAELEAEWQRLKGPQG